MIELLSLMAVLLLSLMAVLLLVLFRLCPTLVIGDKGIDPYCGFCNIRSSQ